jgi:hypothetical protein
MKRKQSPLDRLKQGMEGRLTWGDTIHADAEREQLVRERGRRMSKRALREQVRVAEAARRWIFGPAIHRRRHHDLRHKFVRGGRTGGLPALKEREERESEPVGPHSVRSQGVGKVVLRDCIEARSDIVRSFGGGGRARVTPTEYARIVEEDSDTLFLARTDFGGKTYSFSLYGAH